MSENDRKEILTFIKAKIGKDDFERVKAYQSEDENDYLGFSSFRELLKHQENVLTKATDEKISFYKMLMNEIRTNYVGNMDKESMADFDSDGFVFNKDGRLVVFNER